MNGAKSSTLLLVMILYGFVLLACSSSDSDNSLNDLYESLLQREYLGPISFPNHQVERKAQRSPSLRLRFGRRSDPSISLMEKRFSEEVNKKPIRSPSLRLRFGKRDPSIPMFSSDDYYSNEMDFQRDLRAPATRLRWGRRSDPSVPLMADSNLINEIDVQSAEKRKPVRLRWGRSYKTPVSDDISESNNKNIDNDINAIAQEQNSNYASEAISQTNDSLNRLGY